MTIIKSTTKRGQKMLDSAVGYEGMFLYQIYNSFSPAKQKAWDYCYELCRKEKGTGFGIISHNTFGFSVSWIVDNGIRIETPKNSYLVLFPEYC